MDSPKESAGSIQQIISNGVSTAQGHASSLPSRQDLIAYRQALTSPLPCKITPVLSRLSVKPGIGAMGPEIRIFGIRNTGKSIIIPIDFLKIDHWKILLPPERPCAIMPGPLTGSSEQPTRPCRVWCWPLPHRWSGCCSAGAVHERGSRLCRWRVDRRTRALLDAVGQISSLAVAVMGNAELPVPNSKA